MSSPPPRVLRRYFIEPFTNTVPPQLCCRHQFWSFKQKCTYFLNLFSPYCEIYGRMAERIEVNQPNIDPRPSLVCFVRSRKSVLCGEHLIPSLYPFMTCYQRLKHLSDLHAVLTGVVYKKLSRKCQCPDHCLSNGHTLSKGVNRFLSVLS